MNKQSGIEDSQRGNKTRQALILTGERLFALRGFEAVSVTEVNEAAGIRNRSAIYYHFGSRPGLINAIFQYRFAQVDPLRRAMLAETAALEGCPLRPVFKALIHPLATQLAPRPEGNFYLRFLERTIRENPKREVPVKTTPPTWLLTELNLEKRFAHMPRAVLRARIMLARTLIICGLAEIETQQEFHKRKHTEADEELLIDACVAMMEAPPSDDVVKALAARDSAGEQARG